MQAITVENIRKMGATGVENAVVDPDVMEKFTVVLAQAGLVREGMHGQVRRVRRQPVQPVVVWEMDESGKEKRVFTCFFPQ